VTVTTSENSRKNWQKGMEERRENIQKLKKRHREPSQPIETRNTIVDYESSHLVEHDESRQTLPPRKQIKKEQDEEKKIRLVEAGNKTKNSKGEQEDRSSKKRTRNN